jgi:hypothetical protein
LPAWRWELRICSAPGPERNLVTTMVSLV